MGKLTESDIKNFEVILKKSNPRKRRALLDGFYCNLRRYYAELPRKIMKQAVCLLDEHEFLYHGDKIFFKYLVKKYFEKEILLVSKCGYSSSGLVDSLNCHFIGGYTSSDYEKAAFDFESGNGSDELKGEVDLRQWIWIMRIGGPAKRIYPRLFIKYLKEECYKRSLFELLNKIKEYEKIPVPETLVSHHDLHTNGLYQETTDFLRAEGVDHGAAPGKFTLYGLDAESAEKLLERFSNKVHPDTIIKEVYWGPWNVRCRFNEAIGLHHEYNWTKESLLELRP